MCDLQPALILLSIVILPHLSWQTVEELEVSSAIKPETSSVDGEVEAVTQPGSESSGVVAGYIQKEPRDNELEEKLGDTANRGQAETNGEKEDVQGVIPAIVVSNADAQQETEDQPSLKLGENSSKHTDTQVNESQDNADTSVAKQSLEESSFSAEDTSFPENLSMNSLDESIRPEDLDEKDWSLLTQWSERQRRGSEGDQLRVSFTSEDGEGDLGTYHSYINFGVDDDLLEDMTDPPHKPSHTHTQEETTHLDTIQESDESEEDDDNTGNKFTMPSQMKSTFSAGMFNLQDISSDAIEEIEAGHLDPEDDKDEKRISVDLGGPSESSSSESQSSDEEREGSASRESEKENQRKLKRGRITDKKNVNPIYLSENVRTFGNPISYLGGPTIEYVETDGSARNRNDSLTSTTSLD